MRHDRYRKRLLRSKQFHSTASHKLTSITIEAYSCSFIMRGTGRLLLCFHDTFKAILVASIMINTELSCSFSRETYKDQSCVHQNRQQKARPRSIVKSISNFRSFAPVVPEPVMWTFFVLNRVLRVRVRSHQPIWVETKCVLFLFRLSQ